MSEITSPILLAAALLAALGSASCGAREAQGARWEDVVAAAGDGRLVIDNEGDTAITRVWLVRSHEQELSAGSAPDGFEPVAPGAHYEAGVPMGWWDVWIENEAGADVVLFQSWFGSEQPTALRIESSWWQLGDWLDPSEEGL